MYTASDDQPSYLIFHSFLSFMYTAFKGMESFPLLSGMVVQYSQGLENLREVFTRLLIETSQDFTLRAVPRGKQYGAASATENDRDAKNARMLRMLPAAMAAEMEVERARVAMQQAIGQQQREWERPVLRREPSHRELHEHLLDNVAPILTRQLSNELAERFSAMKSWEDTEHPVVLFYTSLPGQPVEGIDILSLNPRFLDRYISRDMGNVLKHNGVELDKDWRELSNDRAIEIVRGVEGRALANATLPCKPVDKGYVVTIDNLLKMLSIQLRLQNNLPVVIMGETGCGKSSLIRNLCAIIGAPLRTLNIHGGMDDTSIVAWMQGEVERASTMGSARLVCS